MIRVLIVEDEPRVRRSLRQRLELEPDLQIVAEASDGTGALAAISTGPVDVVVMDIRLPGMDGLDVAHVMRCCEPSPHVVLHTVHDSPGARARAIEIGADFVAQGEQDERILDAIRSGTRAVSLMPGNDEAPEAAPAASTGLVEREEEHSDDGSGVLVPFVDGSPMW